MNRRRSTSSLNRLTVRRGAVLVLLVPMMLIFFGLCALVIDLGMVRTTQATMTSACDSAALEGLRWRDQLPPGANPTAALDDSRRAAAIGIVSRVYDTANPPSADAIPFAPGPQFDIQRPSGSTDPLDNLATILPDETAEHVLAMQPNTANAADGDIVTGTYLATATSHLETINSDDTYSRTDFTPSASETADSVLVRLRRVRDNLETTHAGATIWPTLPLLFGRGAAIGALSTDPYPVRRDGISVRSTSIATTAAVLQAGLPIYLTGTNGQTLVAPGVIPIAIYNTAWSSPNDAALPPAATAGQGSPQSVAIVGQTIQLAGFGSAGVVLDTLNGPVSVGDTLPTSALPPVGILRGYAPILNEASIVIGFGWAQLNMTGSTPTLTKLSPAGGGGGVAPWNVSANLRDAWASVSAHPDLMTANATVADPLLSAVGVRSTDLTTN